MSAKRPSHASGMRFAWVAIFCAIGFATALAPPPMLAAEADIRAAHAKAVAANPEGMSFTIELVDGRTRFRVGELIPLDLVYTFDDASAFQINDGLAGGSGVARLLEVFRVSPQAGNRRLTAEEPSATFSAGGTPQDAKADRSYIY